MAAEYLARVAGVESVTDFVNEMFAAKSDTSGLDVRDVRWAPHLGPPRRARCQYRGLTGPRMPAVLGVVHPRL